MGSEATTQQLGPAADEFDPRRRVRGPSVEAILAANELRAGRRWRIAAIVTAIAATLIGAVVGSTCSPDCRTGSTALGRPCR